MKKSIYVILTLLLTTIALAGGYVNGRVVDTGSWPETVYYWIRVEDSHYLQVDSVRADIDEAYITHELSANTYTVICSLYDSADSCLAGLGKLNIVVTAGDTTLCVFDFPGSLGGLSFTQNTWGGIKVSE